MVGAHRSAWPTPTPRKRASFQSCVGPKERQANRPCAGSNPQQRGIQVLLAGPAILNGVCSCTLTWFCLLREHSRQLRPGNYFEALSASSSRRSPFIQRSWPGGQSKRAWWWAAHHHPMPTLSAVFYLNGETAPGGAVRCACSHAAERARAGAGCPGMRPIARNHSAQCGRGWMWPECWTCCSVPGQPRPASRSSRCATMCALDQLRPGFWRPWESAQATSASRLRLRIPGPPPDHLDPVSPPVP